MNKLKGLFTALITPFDTQNEVDEEGLRRLIRFQLEAHVDGITPLGTTGEAPTLNEDEKHRIIAIAKEEIGSRSVLMVGTGSNSTSHTIQSTLEASELGADLALVIVPYYNKPTQQGLFLHFQALAKESNIPIVIYNHPGRTGQGMQIDTIRRLAEIPNIIGIKDATGNMAHVSDLIEAINQIRPDFSVMSGNDEVTLPLMALGGHGVVSVASNLMPKEMKALVDYASKGNFLKAKEEHYKIMPFIRATSIEINPIPIKAAMNLCGLPAGECRLPLCNLSSDNAVQLEQALRSYQILDCSGCVEK